VRISGGKGFAKPADVPLSILVPAFVTSELEDGIPDRFLLFIPFVIIDRGGKRAHVDGHDDAVAV
jgi:flagellar biosynthetic protein FliP